MRVVVQRVSCAEIRIEGILKDTIADGLVLLTGFSKADSPAVLDPMIDKLLNLRIFSDESGKLNKSLSEIRGESLIVSNFTLYGDCRKGRRPDFAAALGAEAARGLYHDFVTRYRAASPGKVAEGEFQAIMQVSLVNEGPVTLIVEI